MTTTIDPATGIDCPGCGARNATDVRRCRICARLLNRQVPHLERGLAALHPDTGHGATFTAAWGRGPGRPASATEGQPADHSGGADTGSPASTEDGATDGSTGQPTDAERAEIEAACAARRWESFPVEATIARWEPTQDGTDESFELAAAIVLDAPLRNGPTPPPIEVEHEHFDLDGLDWDRRRP